MTIHPSHHLNVAEEMARLRQEIGQLKTSKSTLESQLEWLQNREPDDALLDAAGTYLESEGAKVTVIGGIQMRHEVGAREFNLQLVINFLGTPPQNKEQTSE
jgi:hypothetical protein